MLSSQPLASFIIIPELGTYKFIFKWQRALDFFDHVIAACMDLPLDTFSMSFSYVMSQVILDKSNKKILIMATSKTRLVIWWRWFLKSYLKWTTNYIDGVNKIENKSNIHDHSFHPFSSITLQQDCIHYLFNKLVGELMPLYNMHWFITRVHWYILWHLPINKWTYQYFNSGYRFLINIYTSSQHWEYSL